ncbi:CYTH domain-containing protein [Microbacterium sp. zg-Y818]|uniref:CYTH domain-containing protein n=1 Tax=unclassified Microbacterium TaxID=2609290 RepID=UPI00214C60F5|nr:MULTISPECIES: CYTH domain-containing protein [unclassified Microbacterium]MCR2800606.1 CYTH domain-containing protein [Microbacterium sp. zg.Y818]WIM23332.1 CYTH domain-containing protein [Microbacterium sp. zg-Y818]
MAGKPDRPTADDEPQRSLEVERKYDVDDTVAVPDWTALPGVAAVGEAERRDLDARYLDTAEGHLARAGVAVRRRSGGPDAGWHIKISTPEGKHEWAWPLGEEPAADLLELPVPSSVVDALSQWAEPPFTALARIRNARVAYALTDAAGGLVAEFVDDHVTARDERHGTESSWREWELELGPAAPADPQQRAALFAAADALVAEAGGRPAASGSKLARALGF